MESYFSHCIASVGMVAFQGMENAWIKHVANLGLLKNCRITVYFIAPSLFLNTAGVLRYLDIKEVLWANKPSLHWCNKNSNEKCRA